MQTRKEVCKDFSEQGWEVRFNFSLKQAIKEERNVLLTKLLQLLTTSYMITKELSTNGRQFFQGVLHFSALRLRAIEHTTAREPLPPAPVPRCEWLASAPAESRPGARAWEATRLQGTELSAGKIPEHSPSVLTPKSTLELAFALTAQKDNSQ